MNLMITSPRSRTIEIHPTTDSDSRIFEEERCHPVAISIADGNREITCSEPTRMHQVLSKYPTLELISPLVILTPLQIYGPVKIYANERLCFRLSLIFRPGSCTRIHYTTSIKLAETLHSRTFTMEIKVS